jgi:MFS family permease
VIWHSNDPGYGSRSNVRDMGYAEPIIPRFVYIRSRLFSRSTALDVRCKNDFPAAIGLKENRTFRKIGFYRNGNSLFLTFAYGGITAFIPLFSNSVNVNSGAFFLAYAATLALTLPIAGKLSDRYGGTFVIIPALVITISALIALSFSAGLFGILVSAVLYGVGFGSAMPALQAATIRLARPDRKGVANASLLTATDLGIGLGAIMLGWVSQHTSYQVLFTVSAVSVAISLMLFTFRVKRLLKPLKSVSLPSETS